MMITVEAIYENGVLKPKQALTLPEGTEVRVSISPLQEEQDPLDAVIGICTEGPDISLAERHDEFLYGIKPRDEKQP